MRIIVFLLILLPIKVNYANSSNDSLVHQWRMSEDFQKFLDAHIGQTIVYLGPDGHWYETLVIEKDKNNNFVGINTHQIPIQSLSDKNAVYDKEAFHKYKESNLESGAGSNESGAGWGQDLAGSALKSGALIMLEEGVLDLLGIQENIAKYTKEIAENNKVIEESRIKMRELFGLVYERLTTVFSSKVLNKTAILISKNDLNSLDQGHIDYLKELLNDMSSVSDDDGSFLNKTIHVSESLLNQISIQRPEALRIKIVGVELLKYAKTSAEVGTIGDAIYFAKFANGVANLLNHPLSPAAHVADIYYDLYETVTGYSATSSYVLHPSERAFSFYKFISHTGLAKKMTWISKTLGRIVKKVPGASAGWSKTLKLTNELDQYILSSKWREIWLKWSEKIKESANNLKFMEAKFRKFQKLSDKWEIFFEMKGDELVITAKDSKGELPDKVFIY